MGGGGRCSRLWGLVMAFLLVAVGGGTPGGVCRRGHRNQSAGRGLRVLRFWPGLAGGGGGGVGVALALQQPIPTDRHDTTNGWTSEKLPSVQKWRMNTPPGLNGSGG